MSYVLTIIRVDDESKAEFLRESIAGMGRLYERDQVGQVVTEAVVVPLRHAFSAAVAADPRLADTGQSRDLDEYSAKMGAFLNEYFPRDD